MCELPDYVRVLLDDVAKSEGFTEGYEISVKPGCSQGDGFLGILISVTISGLRYGENSGDLHLVCKSAPQNAARREGFESIVLCKREALMYEKILPALANFERDKGLVNSDRFTAYPKCYVSISDETKDQFVIIMEDVRPKGYSMWVRSDPLPIKYTCNLFDQLAKMHAISFALKQQRPRIYNEFREINDVVTGFIATATMADIINASLGRCLAAVEDPKHIEIVTDMIKNRCAYYDECISAENVEPFGAVTHGDCWINNILFRFNDNVSLEYFAIFIQQIPY